MLLREKSLVGTVTLLLFVITGSIDPVCFNCHCSSYYLDTRITCKNAITSKTSYFTLWTKLVTVLAGSDVILAAEVKSHSEDYCWCTDAKLEWNGLLQNSSGRLLTVHMENTSEVEKGNYWAVLFLNDNFYFSDSIYLNVSGLEEAIPSEPLVVDPKIGALVVGVLFVVIMLLGISIHCWKVQKRAILRSKQRKLEALQQFQSESHVPLTWDLQLPANTIAETEPAVDTSPAPSDAEEGSVYSKDRSSDSISSDEFKEGEKKGKGEKRKGEEKQPANKVTTQESVPPCNRVSPIARVDRPSYSLNRGVAFVPIKDDRFTTERSWYRSLNNEVVSQGLLTNKEREARREEKKKLKALGKAENTIAHGLRQYADIGAIGSAGQISQISQNSAIDPLNNFLTNFRYGRSLPTPQPAGARPTVMTIFPTPAAMRTFTHGGATIHTTNPEKKRHVKAIFSDQGPNAMSKARSVQFSDSNSRSLKNTPVASTEGLAKKNKARNSQTERKKSSSDSSLSKDHVNKKKKKKDSSKKMQVPQLDLTPASPTIIEPDEELVKPTGNRFTVKRVESDELDGITSSTDPLVVTRSKDEARLQEEEEVEEVVDSGAIGHEARI